MCGYGGTCQGKRDINTDIRQYQSPWYLCGYGGTCQGKRDTNTDTRQYQPPWYLCGYGGTCQGKRDYYRHTSIPASLIPMWVWGTCQGKRDTNTDTHQYQPPWYLCGYGGTCQGKRDTNTDTRQYQPPWYLCGYGVHVRVREILIQTHVPVSLISMWEHMLG